MTPDELRRELAAGRVRPAYLLLGATLFVQALVWFATIGLLTAGNTPPVS